MKKVLIATGVVSVVFLTLLAVAVCKLNGDIDEEERRLQMESGYYCD